MKCENITPLQIMQAINNSFLFFGDKYAAINQRLGVNLRAIKK
jgi:hypothetical protein